MRFVATPRRAGPRSCAALRARSGVASGLHRIRNHHGREVAPRRVRATPGSKVERGWHMSMTQNRQDATTAIRIAIGEAERLRGGVPLIRQLTNHETGEVRPIALVTDNAAAFQARGFARSVDSRPELIQVRTKRRITRAERRPRMRLRVAEARAARPRRHPGRGRRWPPRRRTTATSSTGSDRSKALTGDDRWTSPRPPAWDRGTNTKRARNAANVMKQHK